MIFITVKAVRRVAGSVIDAEDRRAFAQGAIVLLSAGVVLVTAAATAAVALRIFEVARPAFVLISGV